MKKFAKIFAIALMFVLVTGCGKKITCTYTSSDSFYGKDTKKVVREYASNGVGIVKYTETETMSYSKKYMKSLAESDSKQTIDDLYKDALEECDDYNGLSFVTCKVTKKGNKITRTITYNLKGVSKDSLEKQNISYSVLGTVTGLLEATYDKDKLAIKDPKESLYRWTCK